MKGGYPRNQKIYNENEVVYENKMSCTQGVKTSSTSLDNPFSKHISRKGTKLRSEKSQKCLLLPPINPQFLEIESIRPLV